MNNSNIGLPKFQCQNCSLIFDSQSALSKHQSKFCLNSKYGDLQLLQKQFNQKSKGRDISLYGKMSLVNKQLKNYDFDKNQLGINTSLKNNSMVIDKQYQSILDQLTNKQDLKKKLQRQKHQAYQQLQYLQKRQNDLMIDTKQQQLHQVLKRRKQLQEEQTKIFEQMKQYQNKKKQMEKQIQQIDREDFIYKQAQLAGKLARQREILQDKKRQMEVKLKQKKKQKNQIIFKLSQSKVSDQIYIPPDFRKKKDQKYVAERKFINSQQNIKTPEDSLDGLSYHNNSYRGNGSAASNKGILPQPQPQKNAYPQQYTSNISPYWSQNLNPAQSIVNPFNNSNPNQSVSLKNQKKPLNQTLQKYSDPYKVYNDDPYFTPDIFSKNQKLLTDMLNRNGKSQQDLFIQQLNAQQFDALNLLAKIPKTSQLYEIKLRQYKQLSKMRDQYKKQAHQKRVQKMKKEFEYQKKLMQKQMANSLWVDQNRKIMLAQQINIVKNQQQYNRNRNMNNNQNNQNNMQNQDQYQNNQMPMQQYNNNMYQNQNSYQQNINQQRNSQNSYKNNPYQSPQQASYNNSQQQIINSIPSIEDLRNQNQFNKNIQNPSINNNSKQKIPSNQNLFNQNKMNNKMSNNPSIMNSNNQITPPSQLSQNSNNNITSNKNNSSNRLSNQSVQPHNNLSNNNRNSNRNSNQMQPLINQQQNNLNSNMWGFKIHIEMLKNYIRQKPVRVRLVLLEQNLLIPNPNDQRVLKYQFTTGYHYQRTPQSQGSIHPDMNNKFDKLYNIVYKEDLIIPINLQQRYNQNQNQLYLFIFVQEKDQTKISLEPTIYSWYNMKLTHFGQLKEGQFTFNLYADQNTYPIPSDMNRKKNKLKDQITIVMNQVILEKVRPPPQFQQIAQKPEYKPPEIVQIASNLLNKTPNQSIQSMKNVEFGTQMSDPGKNMDKQVSDPTKNNINSRNSKLSNPSKQESNKQTTPQNPNSQTSILSNSLKNNKSQPQIPYIPNDYQAQFIQIKSKQPKNIDFSICQLRTLPSYTGPVKIQLTFIDKDNVQVIPKEQILAQLGKDMYNPMFNYIRKVRNQRLLSPTTILFIRILALNALDYQIYMLGFTIFYCFFDKNTYPCHTNNELDYFVSTGYFQLPIFWGFCKPHHAKIDQIIDQYPLIPCASILIGCKINQKPQNQKIPLYSQKVYNTLLFNVQQTQEKLFVQQYKRQKLDSEKLLKQYIKFKGISTKYSLQETKNYIFKSMSFTNDQVPQLFPLDYMAQYNQFFGIYLSIDKITIPKLTQTSKFYYFATACLSPPAKYYQSLKRKQLDTSDLKIIYDINSQSSTTTQLVFQDNQIRLQPKYDQNCCFIIQFFRVKIGDSNQIASSGLQKMAYVIIPVFKQIQGVRCVNIIKQTVNTYNGKFETTNIYQIKNNLPQYLDNLLEQVQPSDIQVNFRLLNGYFTNQFKADITNQGQQNNNQTKNKINTKQSSFTKLYSRVIDFQNTKKNVKKLIERSYNVSL